MNIDKEIFTIDRKLDELRKRWVLASKPMRMFIEAGAKLLKDKRQRLIDKNVENLNPKLF